MQANRFDSMRLEQYHCNSSTYRDSWDGNKRLLLLRLYLNGIFLYYYVRIVVYTYIIDGFTPTLDLMYMEPLCLCICAHTVRTYVYAIAESSTNEMTD